MILCTHAMRGVLALRMDEVGQSARRAMWTWVAFGLAEAAVYVAVAADTGGWSMVVALRQELGLSVLAHGVAGALCAGLVAWRGWEGSLVAGLGLGVGLALGERGPVPLGLWAGLWAVSLAVGWGLGRWRSAQWGLVGIGGLAVLGMGWPEGRALRPTGAERPVSLVLLVVLDTVRADWVGPRGGEPSLTPALDGLAVRGTRFEHAWSTASWTLPAHASLFTGELPSVHGAHAGHARLSEGLPTLAERMGEAGYRTIGLSANGFVSPSTGLDRGFSRFGLRGERALMRLGYWGRLLRWGGDLGAAQLTDEVVAIVKEVGEGGPPTMIFVNYLEAHEPLGSVPWAWLERYVPAPVDRGLGRAWLAEMPHFWGACVGEGRELGALRCERARWRGDAVRVQGARGRYAAGVAYLDAQVGRLLGAVDEAGLRERTLVVVTSDHGELLGEDEGRLGHMVWLEPELLRVPLIVGWPAGVQAERVVKAPVSLVDVPATVAAVTGAQALGAGLDLRRARADRVAVAETHAHPEAVRARWAAVFGDDFSAAGRLRRVTLDVGLRARAEAGALRGARAVEDAALLELPFDGQAGGETPALLRAIGYQ